MMDMFPPQGPTLSTEIWHSVPPPLGEVPQSASIVLEWPKKERVKWKCYIHLNQMFKISVQAFCI